MTCALASPTWAWVCPGCCTLQIPARSRNLGHTKSPELPHDVLRDTTHLIGFPLVQVTLTSFLKNDPCRQQQFHTEIHAVLISEFPSRRIKPHCRPLAEFQGFAGSKRRLPTIANQIFVRKSQKPVIFPWRQLDLAHAFKMAVSP